MDAEALRDDDDAIEDREFDAARYARKAPFPWFGGKSRAAPLVWQLLGDVEHYVEPFAGSLAVLLNRPHPCNRPYHSETVNDADALLVNAWRGIQFAPDAVAEAASWPVSEACKSARQIALLRWRETGAKERIAGDPRYFDSEMAGWWLWAVAVQIGGFTDDGAWTADPVTGRIVKMPRSSTREPGVSRKIPNLGDNGSGVCGPLLREPGISLLKRNFPEEDDFHPITMPRLRWWMRLLSARLRHVRICNGDWSRVCTSGAMHTLSVRTGGVCGVFLDPPYFTDDRTPGLYSVDDGSIAASCRAWAIEAGRDPRNRIVLTGYDSEHEELERHGWTVHEWFKYAGFMTPGRNKSFGLRERLWASPHCLRPDMQPEQLGLFK